MRVLMALTMLPLLGGCIASAAVDVVTLPVKAASKTVDLLTTSQSEADEKRGRAVRKQEECLAREERRARREERAPDATRCEGD
jgi:hypothetical protein